MCESKDMFPGESAATALTYGAVEINYEKQQVTCFTCSMLDAKANIKAKKKKKSLKVIMNSLPFPKRNIWQGHA